jgi:hypothetical protein
MRPPVRIRSIGTKVTEAQFALLEERAHSEGLTISEWARNELLEPHNHAQEILFEVLLAELIATRTVLINLTFSITQASPMSAEVLRELLSKADESKTLRAQEIIQFAKNRGTQRPE